MATLSFKYEWVIQEDIQEEGAESTVGTASLTYAVSNTSDSIVTVSVSSLKITNVTNYSMAFPYEIIVGGTTIASGSLTVAKKASSTKTLSGSRAFMRNVTATTTQLRVTGESEENFFCNKSVTITIPMSGRLYTISYDANGGTGAPSQQQKAHDVTLTLSSTKPTRSGYAFRRWNTSTNDRGTYYNPGGSYTNNNAIVLYAIWNPIISFDANGGTGAPSAQTKTYGVALTLSSTRPTRSGYAFKGWDTSSSATTVMYNPGATYNPDNLSRTLYAVWWKEPSLPTISALSVVRVDANGNADDEGEYGKVTVTWSVDRTSQTVADNRGTLQGVYVASSNTSQETSLTWTGAWYNSTGGTATATFPASLDEQYLVLVTLTDAKPQSVSKADILTRAEFVMDFRVGGKAIGIGSAAPQDGLLIGWDTEIVGDLDVRGRLSARSETLDRDGAIPSSQYTYEDDRCFDILDKDGDLLGRVRCFETADGYIGTTLMVANEPVGGGTVRYGGLSVAVGKDGTARYYVSSPDAFRSAIGLTRTEADVSRTSALSSSGTLRIYANPVSATLAGAGFSLASALNSSGTATIGNFAGNFPPTIVSAPVSALDTTLAKGVFVLVLTNGTIILYNYSGTTIPTSKALYFTVTWAL